MLISTVLNVTGMTINMIGGFLMFYYTPPVKSQMMLFQKSEYEEMHRRDVFQNTMVRLGMLLLFLGFLLQLIVVFL